MNLRRTIILLSTLGTHAHCQDATKDKPELTAVLFTQDGSQPAWIMEANKNAIRYRESDVAVDSLVANRTDIKHIYLYEPRELYAAQKLYQARKYEEAKSAFQAIRERYKAFETLDNSPGVVAAFYEMESMRKLGDLEGLEKALQDFDKSRLANENQQRQVDLYVLWRLLQEKNWKSLENLTKERAKTRLPGDQRAQVAYLQGMALEGLERPDEAMLAYQTALVADSGASEEITRLAALRILDVLSEDEDVKRAIRVWGTADEKKNTRGYNRLLEASALAVLFEKFLGGGSPLPNKLKDLPKFRPAPEKSKTE